MAFLPQTRRQQITLLVLIVVLIFVAVDIYFGTKYSSQRDSNFRAFRWDSGTLWQLKSSYRGTAWGKDIHTNSAGFRGGEEYPIKSKHNTRIITFGDSRTYGFGVKDDETYSHILQETLRRNGIDAEVINAGVHGFSAVQCRIRLQQLLRYKPFVAVFAPSYNDRRYLAVRPPDNSPFLPWLARIRKVVDFIQTSNTVFAFFYEIGKSKLETLRENPPGLDEVEVRVSAETFEEELNEIVRICNENDIQPIFLRVYQDPFAFSLVEKADAFLRKGDANEAVEIVEEALNTIPDRAYSMSRWILGRAYRTLGEEEKAKREFANHQPLGSIFGESVLRSEAVYFSIFEKIAKQKLVPMSDARDAMVGDIEDPAEAQDRFREFFIDECHYNAEGHRRMGEEISQLFLLGSKQ